MKRVGDPAYPPRLRSCPSLPRPLWALPRRRSASSLVALARPLFPPISDTHSSHLPVSRSLSMPLSYPKSAFPLDATRHQFSQSCRSLARPSPYLVHAAAWLRYSHLPGQLSPSLVPHTGSEGPSFCVQKGQKGGFSFRFPLPCSTVSVLSPFSTNRECERTVCTSRLRAAFYFCVRSPSPLSIMRK